MPKPKRFAPRADVPSPAQIITDAILARLEAGTRPWRRPWGQSAIGRPLRHSGVPYRGINTFWLDLICSLKGYTSPFWMTYRQAAALGGQVRKGERATIAIFHKTYGKTVNDAATGEDRLEGRRVLKSFPVFNACQIDGLAAKYHPAPVEPMAVDQNPERLAELQTFFDAIPSDVRHGGSEAFYDIAGDYIQMPPPEVFVTYDHYAGTRAHETLHWTGAAHRLDRPIVNRFGTAKYAEEEIVVDLAAAIVGAELGIPSDHLDDHASYIAHWIRILKADPKAILTFASKADQAATYLLDLAGRTRPVEDAEDDDANDVRAEPERSMAELAG